MHPLQYLFNLFYLFLEGSTDRLLEGNLKGGNNLDNLQ
jgi:hypothetical protein